MRAKYFPKSLLLTCLSLLTFVAADSAQDVRIDRRPPRMRTRSRRALFRYWIREARQRPFVRSSTLSVKAEISGFLSRVTVTQQFENPFTEKIEAVYTFPVAAERRRR